MYIFLDESGDLGFNFDKNTSTHFVITILVCHNKQTLFTFKSAVKRTLLNKCNRKNTKHYISELKGSETTLQIKQYFYTQLLKKTYQNWELYSIVLDKQSLLKSLKQKPEPHRLYNILSREIIEQVNFSNLNQNIQLYVDKSKGRKERDIFDQFLKHNIEPKLPVNITLNIRHAHSDTLEGLQVVDMFCYGVAKKYYQNDEKWYSIFSKKISTEITWKPKLE